MLINTATLEALRTDFSLQYQNAYDSAEVWYPQAVSQIPSSTKQNTYGWVEKALKLREWVGERIAVNLKSQSYVLANKSYEGTIELDRDDIEDDNLGMFQSMIVPSFGEAVKKHPQELIAQMISDNTALAWDGLPLFDNAHKIGTSTYDNLDSLTLTADNVETVYNKMVAYLDETGRSLNVRPTHMLIAPQLRRTALQILQATTTATAVKNVAGAENVAAAGTDNVMKGWMDIVIVPEWSGTAGQWALADLGKAIKPFVYQLRRPAQFVARDNPADPKVFDTKKFTYGTEGRWNVGITLPFLVARGHA